jgi:uncharacterized membrane protein
MKSDRSRAFAVLVAVFLIGAIMGVGGTYLWLKPSAAAPRSIEERNAPTANNQNPANSQPPKPPDFNLSSEQDEQLGSIWKETGERLQSLMHDQREMMTQADQKRKEIWDENDRKVRSVLNQGQKEKFDVWIKEVRNWRERPRRRGMEAPKENRKQPDRQ